MGKFNWQTGLKDKLKEAVMFALSQDPKLIVPFKDLEKAEFKTETYFQQMGLERNELKRLERMGLAIRGYTKNHWVAGETLPNGKVVDEGKFYRAQGHRVAWILILPEVQE